MNQEYSLLEKQFQDEISLMIRECKKIQYNPNIFISKVMAVGAVQTAKELGGSPKQHDGFTTLYMKKRLDISIEAVMIKEKYKLLFTDEERTTARKKLIEAGYSPK